MPLALVRTHLLLVPTLPLGRQHHRLAFLVLNQARPTRWHFEPLTLLELDQVRHTSPGSPSMHQTHRLLPQYQGAMVESLSPTPRMISIQTVARPFPVSSIQLMPARLGFLLEPWLPLSLFWASPMESPTGLFFEPPTPSGPQLLQALNLLRQHLLHRPQDLWLQQEARLKPQ